MESTRTKLTDLWGRSVAEVYIPMAQMLSEQLTVQQLLRVADLALNQLDLRQIGEICGEVGLSPTFELKDKDDG